MENRQAAGLLFERLLWRLFDLYRLKAAPELADLGLDELLDQGAVVVEWGDRLVEPGGSLITFEPLGADRRRLRFT